MTSKKAFWVKALFLIILLSIIFVYPEALIPGNQGTSFFKYSFPAKFVALTCSACLIILLENNRKNIIFLLITVSIILLISLTKLCVFKFLDILPLLFIPYGANLFYTNYPKCTQRLLSYWLSCFWLLNLFYCFVFIFLDEKGRIGELGLVGNKNWLSIVVLISSVFAFRVTKNFLKNKSIRSYKILAGLVIFFPTLIIISKTGINLLVPSLLLSVICIKIYQLKNRKITIIATVIVFCFALLFINLTNSSLCEIPRLSYWSTSFNMIKENPITGLPVGFKFQYAEYLNNFEKEKLSIKNIEHPLNEFFFMTAEWGVFGVIWLAITVYIIFFIRVNSQFELVFKYSASLIFFSCMLDKSLTSQALYIIFGLSLGIIYQRKHITYLVSKTKIVLSLLVLFLGTFYTSKVFLGNFYSNKAIKIKDLGSGFKEVPKEDVVKKANLYYKAWRVNPQNLSYAYEYARLKITRLQESDIDEDIINTLKRLGNFDRSTLYLAMYYDLKSMENPEFISLAEEQYEIACSHKIDLYAETYRLLFLTKIKKWEAQKHQRLLLIKKLLVRARKSIVENGRLKEISNGSEEEVLKNVQSVMAPIKYAAALRSMYYPNNQEDNYPKLRGYFNLNDINYFKNILFIYGSTPDFSSLKAMCSYFTDNFTIDDSLTWTLPHVTLRNKKGSSLSVICLMKILARKQGYESVFCKTQKFWEVIFYNNVEILSYSNGNLGKFENDNLGEVFYFDYPEAFMFKNDSLGAVLDYVYLEKSTCIIPEYSIGQLKSIFKTVKISVLEEPFNIDKDKK